MSDAGEGGVGGVDEGEASEGDATHAAGTDGAGRSGTDREQIAKLIDGTLPWSELRNDVLPDPKDPQRFETTRAILEERVDWDEPILVPLNEKLYVVGTDGGRAVKCECSHEFCPADENWKESARVRVREDEEEVGEIYPEGMGQNPDWTFQLREWFCPGCFTQLDVDAVPAGYPVLHAFEPDIDAFYEEWLGRPAPDREGGVETDGGRDVESEVDGREGTEGAR
jgi:acetone carboxylase gamma subunit